MKQADADELAEFRKLGELKKVQKMVQEHPQLVQKDAEREEEKRDTSAAEKLGWKAQVLTKLRKLHNFVIEERDIEVEGQDGKKEVKKMPYARVAADDKAEWVPLDKYAEKHLSDFLPSLAAESGGGGGGTGTRGSAAGNNGQQGVTIPRQTPSTGSAPSNDVVGSTLAGRFVRPSERNAAKK